MAKIVLKDIMKDDEVKALLKASAVQMTMLGYTEHSFRHVRLVANKCGEILASLGHDSRVCELAEIAGYLHDIGNAVNRADHEQSGALLAYDLLRRKGMAYDEAIEIMMAIANHDEKVGIPVNTITAALILSDKADVHRSRVTNRDKNNFDIHDRVNYAATSSVLEINAEKKQAVLILEIDTSISAVMEYFEIFLVRMKMCRNAATFLEMDFHLFINGHQLL